MKKILFAVLLGTCVPFLLSGCNALEAFESTSTDQDRIELAEECLRQGDFDCAVAAYGAITDAALRAEKLCAARLSQAGFGISELVSTLIDNSGSTQVLGRLANALIGWTAARQTAADAAKVQCTAFRTATTSTSTKYRRAILFKTLSAFVRCATLIAKTDVLRTEGGGTCTVPGPQAGSVSQASISFDNTGAVGAGQAGMCDADVAACVEDFSEITTDASDLNSGIPDIGAAFANVPADLKNGPVAAQIGRVAIRGAL